MSANTPKLAVAALLAATLLAGCATTPSAPAAQTAGGSDANLIAAARPAIAAANTEWPGAMRSRDAATLAAPFAETGALVTAGGKAISGRAAIERYYRDARVYRIFDGTTEIHTAGIARAALKSGGALYDPVEAV